jgi:hypothetical protein
LNALRHFIGRLLRGSSYRLRIAYLVADSARQEASRTLCAARLTGSLDAVRTADAAYRAAWVAAVRAEIAWRRSQPRRPAIAAKRARLVGSSAR